MFFLGQWLEMLNIRFVVYKICWLSLLPCCFHLEIIFLAAESWSFLSSVHLMQHLTALQMKIIDRLINCLVNLNYPKILNLSHKTKKRTTRLVFVLKTCFKWLMENLNCCLLITGQIVFFSSGGPSEFRKSEFRRIIHGPTNDNS